MSIGLLSSRAEACRLSSSAACGELEAVDMRAADESGQAAVRVATLRTPTSTSLFSVRKMASPWRENCDHRSTSALLNRCL